MKTAEDPNIIDLEAKGIEDFAFLNRYTDDQCASITTLNLNSNEALSSLAGIHRLSHLQVLDIGGTNVTDLSPLLAIASSLKELRLTNVPVTQEQAATLGQLTKLETLYLDDAFFQGKIIEVKPLTALRELKTLSLSGNPDIENIQGFSSLVQIQELDISGTQVRDLTPLRAATKLKALTLKDIEGLSFNDLSPITALPLTKLEVDDDLAPIAQKILKSSTTNRGIAA